MEKFLKVILALPFITKLGLRKFRKEFSDKDRRTFSGFTTSLQENKVDKYRHDLYAHKKLLFNFQKNTQL